jgi:hypothetical protein
MGMALSFAIPHGAHNGQTPYKAHRAKPQWDHKCPAGLSRLQSTGFAAAAPFLLWQGAQTKSRHVGHRTYLPARTTLLNRI